MNELARLLTLVPFISNHQGISVKELAQEFMVSEREILRNLNTLFLCGLPGYTPLELMEIDFEDGYVTIRNAETLSKPRAMGPSDAVMALVALSHMAEQESELREKVERVIAKLVLSIGIDISIDAPHSSRLVREIETAIGENRRIGFSYLSRYKDELSQREVSPLHIKNQNGVLYLTGYCHRSEDFRTFSLDRISDCLVLEGVREFPEYKEDRIEITIRIEKSYRKFIEIFGGEKFQTFSSLWAVRAVIAALGDVELLSPSDIRQEVAARARLALAEYTSLG